MEKTQTIQLIVFLFLFFINLIPCYSLENLDKEKIFFYLIDDDYDLNQTFFIEGMNFDSNLEIFMQCKTTSGKKENYFPFLFSLNNSIMFELNFLYFENCEINSITNQKEKIIYLENEKPFFNFTELSNLKNIQFKGKILESPIDLRNFYIKTLKNKVKINFEEKLNGKYI